MIYNIWGPFLLSIFKFYRKWKRVGKGHGKEKASIKKKPQGLFLRLKSSLRNCFLPSFLFIFFFPLLDVKITKKILSRKQKPQYIYYIHLAAAPVYLQKCCLLSTCTNYFNTWSFSFKLRLLYRKFLEDKSRLQEGTELFNIFTLFFFFFFKELTYFQPKRKRLVFIF